MKIMLPKLFHIVHVVGLRGRVKAEDAPADHPEYALTEVDLHCEAHSTVLVVAYLATAKAPC
jgi:hypothetical protein